MRASPHIISIMLHGCLLAASVHSAESIDQSPEAEYSLVQTLQVALSHELGTFVIDMHAICCDGPSPPVPTNTSTDAAHSAEIDVMQTSALGTMQSMSAVQSAICIALGELFSNTQIAVLGFGVSEDLLRLAASYPTMACFSRISSVVDLSGLAKLAFPAEWGSGYQSGLGSLSKLCERVLGLPLNKEQQCSSWHRRPLTPAQVVTWFHGADETHFYACRYYRFKMPLVCIYCSWSMQP